MDDDQTPIKPRSERGSRGPTRLKHLALRRVVGEKTRVDIDVNTGVAFGPKANEFMSYLGVVSRERLSVPTSPRSSTQRLTSDIVHRCLVMEGNRVR